MEDPDLSPQPAEPISELRADLIFYSSLWNARATLSRVAPKVLWHYTSGEGLIGIVESGELLSTQVSCLNDQTELRLAAKLLKNALKNLQKRYPFELEGEFLVRALEQLEHNVALESDVFVASFSEAANDLAQWRAYTSGEGGYAIGFNSEGIQFGLEDDNLVLRVEYEKERQQKIMTAVAEAALAHYRHGLASSGVESHVFIKDTAIPKLLEGLAYVGPFLKNSAFRSEREWRVAWRLPEGQEHRLRVRQKRTLLSRHFPLNFRPVGAFGDKLPIVSVGVGPCRHPGVSGNSVVALLRSKGYPVESAPYHLYEADGFPSQHVGVWACEIPYQVV